MVAQHIEFHASLGCSRHLVDTGLIMLLASANLVSENCRYAGLLQPHRVIVRRPPSHVKLFCRKKMYRKRLQYLLKHPLRWRTKEIRQPLWSIAPCVAIAYALSPMMQQQCISVHAWTQVRHRRRLPAMPIFVCILLLRNSDASVRVGTGSR
jgi:hypothetical protein